MNLLAPMKKKGEALPNSKFQRLNNFLFEIDAESIQVKGNLFTWKKKVHTHLIYERLDRVIARKDWLTMYPNTFEEHGSFTCSDHRSFIVSFDIAIIRQKVFPF